MKRSAFLWSTGIKYSQRLCGDTAELMIILTKSNRDATIVVPHLHAKHAGAISNLGYLARCGCGHLHLSSVTSSHGNVSSYTHHSNVPFETVRSLQTP
jgi:hypothetical protein